jgi:hypothetical protein
MPVGAIIGGAASIGGALLGASASKKASKAQAKAADKASQTQLAMYRQTREDLKPFKHAGQYGIWSMLDLFGLPNKRNPKGLTPWADKAWEAYKATPYYTSPLKEYIRGLDYSAAARGNLLSSGQLRRVGELSADYANRQFGSYMDRLSQLAGIGANAAAQTGNAATATGRGVAETQLAAGEARAAGYIGQANAINQGLQGVASNLAYLSQNPGYFQKSIY